MLSHNVVGILVLLSDAHFCWTLITDRSIRTLVQLKGQIRWSHVTLLLGCRGQAWYYFPLNWSLRSVLKTEVLTSASGPHRSVDKCIRTTWAPCFGWSKQPHIVQDQSTLCFVGFILIIAEPKVNSWLAAVLGLIVNDVNFNFSCLVHNNGLFSPLQVWYPTVSAL